MKHPERGYEMEEWQRKLMYPTRAESIRENISLCIMTFVYGLGFIYGHERINDLLDRVLTKACDAEGNYYPQE